MDGRAWTGPTFEVLATAELHLTTVENLLALPPAFLRDHWEVWRVNITRDLRRAPVLVETALREPRLSNASLIAMARVASGASDTRIAPSRRTGPRRRTPGG